MPDEPGRALSALPPVTTSTASASASGPPSGSAIPLPALPLVAPSSAPPAAAKPRKRRKDPGPAQGRLVFSAGGVGVGAPPPPPAKKRRGRKEDATPIPAAAVPSSVSAPASTAGSDSATPSAIPAPPTVDLTADTPARCITALSPDSSEPEVEVIDVDAGASVSHEPRRARAAAHPFFSKARVRGSGSPADPVCLDDDKERAPVPPDPRRPRKVERSDKAGGPVHSFFRRENGDGANGANGAVEGVESIGRAASASTAATGTTTGTTLTSIATAAARSKPRTRGATPASGTSTPGTKPKVHSFFSLARPAGLQNGWGVCREGEEPTAPWPSSEWAHVGASTYGRPGPARVPRRARQERRDDDGGDFWTRVLGGPSRPREPPSPTMSLLPSFPPFILDHPAIRAVLSDNGGEHETWCERHRPRTASAVLGNEVEAAYLRDWLSALSVGQAERGTRVIRRVRRRRAPDPERDWIVDDIGLYGAAEPIDDAFDDWEDLDDAQPYDPDDELPLGARPASYPPLAAFVGNTIVLEGPTGTGKTAAVYAAAAELGWEVFEMYPGAGRRTGTALLAAVGDVGRNHMVRDGRNGQRKDKAAARSFFGDKAEAKGKNSKAKAGAANGTDKPSLSQGSAADPIALDDDTPLPTPVTPQAADAPPPPQPAHEGPKQSLILLDEADILFDEEYTFWPTVVALIAESRRPVVITCNDVSRIPLASLPLHAILHFRPADPWLAQAYLSAIAQRHNVNHEISVLYEQCTQSGPGAMLVDQPLPPNGNEPEARFDLRAAITQLQLDRGRACERRERDEWDDADVLSLVTIVDVQSTNRGFDAPPDAALMALTRELDALSFADAHVAPRAWSRLEVSEIDRLSPCADDEDRPGQLLKPDIAHLYPVLASDDRSASIAQACLHHPSQSLAPLSPQPCLLATQTKYIRALLPLLDPIVPLSSRLLPHPTLFTELVPFVRAVVAADDALEAADAAALARGEARINHRNGRTVRGSGHKYERWLRLDEGALLVARGGGLG